MANQTLPQDFKEFLKLLNVHNIEYLLIGGYAVAYYGYPRTTADIDIWIAININNAQKLKSVFTDFGMVSNDITSDLFQKPGNIVRMGVPPMRIEILNKIDGVEFGKCYANRKDIIIDGVPVKIISLSDLRSNKLKSGRHKDLDDLEHLPKK